MYKQWSEYNINGRGICDRGLIRHGSSGEQMHTQRPEYITNEWEDEWQYDDLYKDMVKYMTKEHTRV